MRAVVIAVALALAGGGARALTPSLYCDLGDAAGTAQALEGYRVWALTEGFVTYEAFETATGSSAMILEYCPEQRQLVLRTAGPGADAVLDEAALAMFEQMMWGDDAFTMSEMERRLREIGAAVQMRTVPYVSCACSLVGQ